MLYTFRDELTFVANLRFLSLTYMKLVTCPSCNFNRTNISIFFSARALSLSLSGPFPQNYTRAMLTRVVSLYTCHVGIYVSSKISIC